MEDPLLGMNPPIGSAFDELSMQTQESAPESAPMEQAPIVSPEKPVAFTPKKLEEDAEVGLNRRESIRSRLREREARLTNLVRSSSGDSAESFIGQMRSVQQSLQKVETEKSELEQELQRLKSATDDDEFLKDKMDGIQEGFMKQVQAIQKLEDEIVTKNNETDHLRDELVSKLRRIVELEFDLETHDVHYTDYSAEQFKLGEEALTEIKEMEREGKHEELGDHSESSGKRLSPRRAQKLISKLLADLDNLEARYKDEKLANARKQEKSDLTNQELRTKIHVLENRLGETKKEYMGDASEKNATPADMMNETFLRKRVETLEAKRALYREEKHKLEKELGDVMRESKGELRRVSFDMDRVVMENEAMKDRISALETDIMDDDPKLAHFAIIEKKIRESHNDIAKLEAANDIKDRQIAALKKDVTKLRMKNIANSGEKSSGDNGSGFSDFDSKLLRDDERRKEQQRAEADQLEGANASYVRDLQRQLQSAQQQLVKKDQELVIERAKAASTAAGLLARITELTGRRGQEEHDKKGASPGKKKGKNTPLRFYL
jgi:chromosome segregation ATPase